MKTVITSSKAPAPVGPYSHAVHVNNMLFLSGQVCKDPVTGELLMESIETETKQVMANLQAILAEAGMDFSHVVKTSIFLTNLNNFSRVNAIYATYFDALVGFPARETVEVSRLPLDVSVEISMVAVKA
jgi:2-iminobutanoate/2-iminopropanoate deaminase